MPQASRAKQSPAARLLAWYDSHARVLPWRAKKGERADPYRVWLSEIMLQQTTVQAVAGYYRKFLSLWPNVTALAEAPLDDVLTAWAGLGYYARARNLHKAAKVVAHELGGSFPATYDDLRALPGVGTYTAGAIAAIAYDLPHAAMDANAERVIARLFAVKERLPKAKEKIRVFGQSLVPGKRAGDFAQALMDLGSAICTPKRPACMSCPLFDDCEGRRQGIQDTLPVKGEKAVRPLRRGAAFVARDATGAVLLVKRPENGLLGAMMQPPLGPWTEDFPSRAEAMKQAPFQADWKKRPGIVRHGFTHFELEIEVYEAQVSMRPKHILLCHPRPSAAKRHEGTGSASGFAGRVSSNSSAVALWRRRKGTQASKSERSSTPGSPSLGVLAHASPGMTDVAWVKDLSKAALPTVMRKIVGAIPARD